MANPPDHCLGQPPLSKRSYRATLMSNRADRETEQLGKRTSQRLWELKDTTRLGQVGQHHDSWHHDFTFSHRNNLRAISATTYLHHKQSGPFRTHTANRQGSRWI